MHFEITASQQAIRKPLTTAQRKSSLFAEAPRIAGQTLRRGQVLRFDEAKFKANEVMLKRLFDAGAIEIAQIDGGLRKNLRDEDRTMADAVADAKYAVKKAKSLKEDEIKLPPPSAPKAAPVIELPATPATEPVKNEAFPTPEELQAAVATENKQTEEQIEQAVSKLTPVEEAPPPPPSAPAPVESSKGKKGRK